MSGGYTEGISHFPIFTEIDTLFQACQNSQNPDKWDAEKAKAKQDQIIDVACRAIELALDPEVNNKNPDLADRIEHEFLPHQRLDRLAALFNMLPITIKYTLDSGEKISVQQVFSQIQEQSLQMIGLPHIKHLKDYHPDQIERWFQTSACLQASSSRLTSDKKILLAPERLQGESGARALKAALGVASKQDLALTKEAILASPSDQLDLQVTYIAKEESLKPNDRSGIPPQEEVLREAGIFQLQTIWGVDFGIPSTMLLPIGGKTHSVQAFVSGTQSLDAMTDQQLKEIPVEEMDKFLIDLMSCNTDRIFKNILYNPDTQKLYLIDNGLCLPAPGSESGVPELREAQLDWITLDQAKTLLNGSRPIPQTILQQDPKQIVLHFKKRMEGMAESAGSKLRLQESVFLSMYAGIILIQEGIRLSKSFQETAITLHPILQNDKLCGGEFVDIYEEHIQPQRSLDDIDEGVLREAFRSVLSKPMDERKPKISAYLHMIR